MSDASAHFLNHRGAGYAESPPASPAPTQHRPGRPSGAILNDFDHILPNAAASRSASPPHPSQSPPAIPRHSAMQAALPIPSRLMARTA